MFINKNIRIFNVVLFIIIFFLNVKVFAGDIKEMIELSRKSCVKVTSIVGNSKGTGFFIAQDLVVTCFHVIAKINQSESDINWTIFPDITVVTIGGQEISAHCISIPSQEELSPLINDFALLKLSVIPSNLSGNILEFTDVDLKNLSIGDNCYYSGYPLSVPTNVTNTGIISGIAEDINLICVQGPVNKGNSGGALISDNGNVIGIISMREGGISKGLNDLSKYIEALSRQRSSVQILGVDPLQAIRATVETLNTYISTGIGYAKYIGFVKEYCKKFNIKTGS